MTESGHYELINFVEGTVTCWKTPEQLRLELNKIMTDFDAEREATTRKYALITAALTSARDFRTAQIVAKAEDYATQAAAEVIAKINGCTVPVHRVSAAELVEMAKLEADRLVQRHGADALKAAHAECADAIAKLTRDREAREEQHAEEVRKSRHFTGGWYSQPAYAGDFVAMPTDKSGHVIELPMSPALRRRMN